MKLIISKQFYHTNIMLTHIVNVLWLYYCNHNYLMFTDRPHLKKKKLPHCNQDICFFLKEVQVKTIFFSNKHTNTVEGWPSQQCAGVFLKSTSYKSTLIMHTHTSIYQSPFLSICIQFMALSTSFQAICTYHPHAEGFSYSPTSFLHQKATPAVKPYSPQ